MSSLHHLKPHKKMIIKEKKILVSSNDIVTLKAWKQIFLISPYTHNTFLYIFRYKSRKAYQAYFFNTLCETKDIHTILCILRTSTYKVAYRMYHLARIL